MFNLDKYLKERAALIEETLAMLLPKEGKLAESMRYTTLGGGKRFRGVLLLAAAEYSGLDDLKLILPAAASLECIQAYSLIHDDLPCMDDDEMRRGKPTNHLVFGEAMALLAGDGLLTFAFGLCHPKAAGNKYCSCNEDLQGFRSCRHGGRAGFGSQLTEMSLSLDQLEQIHLRKTATLICTSLRCGAHLAGASKADLEALTEYGTNFGLAFQIVDDLLDQREI